MGQTAKVLEFPTGISILKRIEDFLTIKLYDSLQLDDVMSIEEKDRKGIEKLVHEKAPFLCIDKAVLINGNDKRIISTSIVTSEMCDGHFPGRSMIPLLLFSKIIALTGEILVSWVKNSDLVPLAIRADNVRAESRKIISPPSLVITEATYLKDRNSFCWVSAKSWVGNENVAAMDKLVYYVMPHDQFISGQ
jgi:3-hydroxymyristoyl/3-hydroxydecanoyl-(acyl carrier protein) dehydratase